MTGSYSDIMSGIAKIQPQQDFNFTVCKFSKTKHIYVMKNGIKNIPKFLYGFGVPKEIISATKKNFFSRYFA